MPSDSSYSYTGMGACWARARGRGEKVLSLRWHAGARVARAASGGGRRCARGRRDRRRVLKQRSQLRRARRRGYAIRRRGLRASACVGRRRESEAKRHWVAGGRVESAPGARQRAGAALAESEVVSAAGDGARDVGEIGGGAATRRLALGIEAQRAPRCARGVKCHWGGWRARGELAWRAATSRRRARGERERQRGR